MIIIKYRKKPIIIEVEVYTEGLEDGCDFYAIGGKFLGTYSKEQMKLGVPEANRRPFIETLEGKMFISEGDYIITGVNGERYPCKPDIFEKSYELVE